jgi:hypothetical protein
MVMDSSFDKHWQPEPGHRQTAYPPPAVGPGGTAAARSCANTSPRPMDCRILAVSGTFPLVGAYWW